MCEGWVGLEVSHVTINGDAKEREVPMGGKEQVSYYLKVV